MTDVPAAGHSVAMPRSSRDPAELRRRLTAWLADRLPSGSDPRVDAMSSTDSNGMSSDTVLVTAAWTADGVRESRRLVVRLAPTAADLPVFPSYDLPTQYAVIDLVRQRTAVPVPAPLWCEPDPEPLGSPFFVMAHVDGRVPPDNLPYTFGDNWLFDAAAADQRQLQDSTVDAVAALHAVTDAEERVPGLQRQEAGETPLRRHVAHTRAWWDAVAAGGMRSPLVERGFDWLADHWPARESPPVLLWGDARIGNVLYDGFTPAALLDWEMAGVGPCELDVGWLVCAHIVLDGLATSLGLPGMPSFLRADDVIGRYESQRGVALEPLQFFLTYSAVQWAVVFLRTAQRTAHFTGQPLPADHDELVYCRATLEAMLAG